MTRAAIAVLSFGGQTLLRPGEPGTRREQLRGARRAARAIVTLAREGYRVAVVPGALPYVDAELVRDEAAASRLPPRSFALAVAASQGIVAHLVVTETRNELRRNRMQHPVTALLTTTLVPPVDSGADIERARAVGPRLDAWQARQASRRAADVKVVDVSGQGHRRVVPSPNPVEILDFDGVDALLEAGHVVIAGVAGGVPVAIDARGQQSDAAALIDNDRTAALLASHLGAELLVSLTGVDQLYVHFGRTEQRPIERIGADELRELHAAGHFPHDSVGPKVDAALEFVAEGGHRAVITSAEKLAAALADRAGTRVSQLVLEGPMRRQIPLFPEAAQAASNLDEEDEP